MKAVQGLTPDNTNALTLFVCPPSGPRVVSAREQRAQVDCPKSNFWYDIYRVPDGLPSGNAAAFADGVNCDTR